MILMDDKGHLVSDESTDELHRFARKIGLKRSWFQDHRFPHYDLTTSRMIKKAHDNFAVMVDSTRTLIEKIKEKRVILPIYTYPDPILEEVSKPVKDITTEIKELAFHMIDTMYDRGALGLAAPQVGHSIRMIVVEPEPESPKKYFPITIINPEIVYRSGAIWSTEGCLSIPNYQKKILRSQYLIVTGISIDGYPIRSEEVTGLAVVLQHEIDHLDGILIKNKENGDSDSQ